MNRTLGTQTNTELARAFRQIVTAGWANLSSGDVEAPTGAFSLISIEPAELAELIDAVFDGEQVITIYPGEYVLREDSDGNATLTEYITFRRAREVYDQLESEYDEWPRKDDWKRAAIAEDIQTMAEAMGPGTTVRRLSDEEARALFSTESKCPHADCGYGECSWLQGGTNGACDVHGNSEGRCQR